MRKKDKTFCLLYSWHLNMRNDGLIVIVNNHIIATREYHQSYNNSWTHASVFLIIPCRRLKFKQ